jgi:hypothetical protein
MVAPIVALDPDITAAVVRVRGSQRGSAHRNPYLNFMRTLQPVTSSVAGPDTGCETAGSRT